jgi:bacterioferritin
LEKLLIGEHPLEMLKNDLVMAGSLRNDLAEAIAFCESKQDYVSRELLEDILEHEEETIDWLESQLWLIENTGVENYLQSMS